MYWTAWRESCVICRSRRESAFDRFFRLTEKTLPQRLFLFCFPLHQADAACNELVELCRCVPVCDKGHGVILCLIVRSDLEGTEHPCGFAFAEGFQIVFLPFLGIGEYAVGFKDFLHESGGIDISMYVGVGMIHLCQCVFRGCDLL